MQLIDVPVSSGNEKHYHNMHMLIFKCYSKMEHMRNVRTMGEKSCFFGTITVREFNKMLTDM